MMQQEGSSRIPWTILGSACLLGFAMWAPLTSILPMEHILKEELLLTHAQTSLLFTIPILMMGIAAIPGGLLGDRIGARKAAGIGAIIIAVGTILRGTATNPSSLMAFTVIYGAGIGLSFPNLPKLVSSWVPREKAGMATGVLSAGMFTGDALALALTMPVVFPITNTFQGTFLIWSIPPIIAAILWWTLVREPPPNIDHDEPVNRGNTSFRQLLRNKSLWLVTILFFLYNVFFCTWLTWSPALMMLKGATPDLAGLITSINVWVAIPTALLIPKLAYKLGLRKPFLWGPSIALALAAWGAIYITLSMSWLLMALVGIALSALFPMIIALPVEIMPKEEVGTASGLVYSIGAIGGVIGPLIGGHILDITGSLDQSLIILIGIAIASVGIALRLPETGTKARNKE